MGKEPANRNSDSKNSPDNLPVAQFPIFPDIPTSSPGVHFTSLLTVPPGEMGDTNSHMELLQVLKFGTSSEQVFQIA